MKRILERYLLPTAACLSLAASGCSDDTAKGPSGRAHLSVSSQALSASDIDRVTVTVSGSGISPNIESNLSHSGNVWSGLIADIPAGTGRTFAGDAFDVADTLLYTGSASGVNIVDDTTAFVTIFLQQVAPPTPFANAVPRFTSLVLSQNPVLPGGVVDLTATASDPDGEMLTYAWTASGGMFSSTSTPSTSWTAPMTEGNYDLTISATDPKGSAAVLTASLVVGTPAGDAQVTIDVNTAPEVQNLTADPSQIDAGQATALDLSASDPDGDVLSFAWTANCDGTFDDPSAEDPTFTLNTVPVTGADCVLSVDITDGGGGSNEASLSIATTGAIVCSGTGCAAPGALVWSTTSDSATLYAGAATTAGSVAGLGDQGGIGRARLWDDGMMIWDHTAVGGETYRAAATSLTGDIFALALFNASQVGVTRISGTTGSTSWNLPLLPGVIFGGGSIITMPDNSVVIAFEMDSTSLVTAFSPHGWMLWQHPLPFGGGGVPRFLAQSGNTIYVERHSPVNGSWTVHSINQFGIPVWTANDLIATPGCEPIGLAVLPTLDLVMHVGCTTDNALLSVTITPSGVVAATTQLATLSSRPRLTRVDAGNVYVMQRGNGDSTLTKLDSAGNIFFETVVGDGTPVLRDLVLTQNEACVVGNNADGTGLIACYEK